MIRLGIAGGTTGPRRSLSKDNTYGINLMREAREYLDPNGYSLFGERFASLADATAKARIDTAVCKLERGLLPDVKSVGEGVHEARIDYGRFADQGVRLCKNRNFAAGRNREASITRQTSVSGAEAKRALILK